MNDLAIHIRDLSKVYTYNPKMHQNLRERFADRKSPAGGNKEIVALKNINLDVQKGSVLGIIGDNGSGKSTLLKIISGITQPSSGFVEIEGRVASILEVGTGFHPDLTGTENIFLSGALMGMARDEIQANYDTIVNFSEIGDYINMAVKHYSSGMFMRLAFSVVAHLNADIVLLDEVFSVGDFSFRQKSLKKVMELSKSERTLILVSHDLHSLERACDHILHLQSGRMVNFGPVTDVVSRYVEAKILNTISRDEGDAQRVDDRDDFQVNALSMGEEVAKALAMETLLATSNEVKKIKIKYEDEVTRLQQEKEVLERKLEAASGAGKPLPDKFQSVQVWDDGHAEPGGLLTFYRFACVSDRHKPPVFEYEDKLSVECEFEKHKPGRMGMAFLITRNLEEQVFAVYTGYSRGDDLLDVFNETGRYTARCDIPSHLFNAGIYSVSIFVINERLDEQFSLMNKIFFKIEETPDIGSRHMDNGRFTGSLKPSFAWKVERTG